MALGMGMDLLRLLLQSWEDENISYCHKRIDESSYGYTMRTTINECEPESY